MGMDRCKACGNFPLDAVEYLEVAFPELGGMTLRVLVSFCPSCGWSERTTSEAVPLPA